jgi:hypothetical protein
VPLPPPAIANGPPVPIIFATSPSLDVVYARWSGVVTSPEFFHNFATYLSDPNYRPGRPELIDLSRVKDLAADFNHVRKILRTVNEQAPASSVETHTVLLAPGDMVFGVGRMYQQLAEMAGGIVVDVVESEPAALRALDLPYSDIDDLLAHGAFIPGAGMPAL